MTPLPIELDPPVRPEPADGPFEIALVLAGAVSAGSYIGGVLDYLIEALDAWEAARAAGKPVPSHRVVLRVITGTSGGAMNAALLANYLDRDFLRISSAAQPDTLTGTTGNPFFDAWVNRIDIQPLLDKRDLVDEQAPVRSVFDSTVLGEIAAEVFAAPETGVPVRPRPWVSDPFRVLLTLGNLRGVPYGINFTGGAPAQHGMTAHADHVRFACAVSGGGGGLPPRPDEQPFSRGCSVAQRRLLSQTALGSGALPPALAPREIAQDYRCYDARQWGVAPGGAIPVPIAPGQIAGLPTGGSYGFVAVDGGVMNNEPIDLAHRVLCGALGHNDRSGVNTRRAILLVDPFPEDPELGPASLSGAGNNPAKPLGLPGTLLALVSAWKNHCRFKPVDLALAQDESVYSRFLMTPDRGAGAAASAGYHLAGGALGGFFGFLHRDYRVHDYLLGRRNAEWFLRTSFALPANNALFAGWSGDAALRQRFLIDPSRPGGPWLPIIPVLTAVPGSAAQETNPLPAWPTGRQPLRDIEKPFIQRFNALYDRVGNEIFGSKFLSGVIARLLRSSARDWAWSKASGAVASALSQRKL